MGRFSYQEIWKKEPDMTYERLSQVISALCEEGKIVPVKNSGKTSFFPSVYREYKTVSPKKDYSSYLPEIGALHPRLSISRYMGRPEEFAENREKILGLSEFLWRQDDARPPEMSVKERSYEIWRDEKFLESRTGRKLLSFNGLDEQELNCYYAPEPFFCTRIGREGMALVIENKDTWYSLGKALKRSAAGRLCGHPVAMLIYGEGNKAARAGALTMFVREEGLGEGEKVCYAGDIDGAGIEILYGAVRHNPNIGIEPFLPLYRGMVSRAVRQLAAGYPLEPSKDERNLTWNRDFLKFFTAKEQAVIGKALDGNCLIPQEILAYPDYEAMCRTDCQEGKEDHV